MNYEAIYNTLQTEGYYFGTFDDFWHDDQDGITKVKFDKAVDFFKSTEPNMERDYTYRHNYIDQSQLEFLKDPNYTGPRPTAEDLAHDVPYSRRDIRKKFVKDIIAGGANSRTTQQWAVAGFTNGQEMCNTFDTLTKSFVSKVYKFLEPNKNELVLAPQYSIYKKDDFSEIHYDGMRKSRACAIVYYFSDPNTYKDTSGGKFVIEKKDSPYKDDLRDNPKLLAELIAKKDPAIDCQIPVYGNYVLMDFLNHNPGHAIECVYDDFVRFAQITFVGVPGSDKEVFVND